ncbi:hypothetical protein AH06_98 [Erwinia phage AH06]|nr:hypothetical protein AH06_98 [Erwinia phage AH06]
MKRTKNIKHDRFRKAWKFTRVSMALMVVSGSFYLVGCDEASDQHVAMYQNADDCSRANPSQKEQCFKSYQNAVAEADRTGPKYSNQADCQKDFSDEQCHQSSSSSGSHWVPYMYGYMYGSSGSYSQPLYSSNRPGSSMYKQTYDAAGNNYGSAVSGRYLSTTRSNLAPKPSSTTITRGGFGATVARVSSAHFSSSHSSGGHSFGG